MHDAKCHLLVCDNISLWVGVRVLMEWTVAHGGPIADCLAVTVSFTSDPTFRRDTLLMISMR